MKCSDKAVYFLGPQVEWISAVSADDGRFLWKYPVKDAHIVIRGDGLYVIGCQGSTGATMKLDPLTGAVLAKFATSRRACTRSTGTADGIYFRGQEGSGRLDVASGRTQWISPMRPSCHVGVIVAAGELYWMPWACDCDLQLTGLVCCGPAGDFAFEQKAADAQRLETAAAESSPASPLPQSPADWPTYRGDNARSGRSQAIVPVKQIRQLWRYESKTVVEPTAPVAAGGLVFVGGLDGIVRAFDAASGQVRWTAYTGGAVRFPPTIAAGRALVGSGDGWVYAFDAAAGRLRWRFRAAPLDRRIPFYGSLLSTWPVASGVLVDRGVAYFAAGITDFDGTHVYAVDAATGRLRWQNNSAGDLDSWSKRGVACQGEMLLHGDQLFLAGGNAVSPGVFQIADGRCLNRLDAGRLGAGAARGRELNLRADGQVTVSGQALYASHEMPILDPALRWPAAVVAARNAELTCGWRRSEERTTWWLTAREAKTKRELWAVPLPEEPVRWGIAVDAQGRIVVATRSGYLVCFAGA